MTGDHARAPLVSVITPTRDRAALLARAIDSVVGQTFDDWELLVVDDASSDDTQDLIAARGATDARIRGIRTERPAGAAAARNRALREARGEWIALLDDDDEWLSDKLERQIAALRRHAPDVAVIHGPYFEVDAAGRAHVRNTVPVPADDPLRALLRGNRVGHSTALVRRDALQAIGGYDESLPRLQDWDLWIRLARVARFAFVSGPLARIHVTPGAISDRPQALRAAAGMLLSKIERADGAGSRAAGALALTLARLLFRAGVDDEGARLVRRALETKLALRDRMLARSLAVFGPGPYRRASRLAGGVLDFRAARAASRFPGNDAP